MKSVHFFSAAKKFLKLYISLCIFQVARWKLIAYIQSVYFYSILLQVDFIYIYIYIYTHTSTYIYMYIIYIYIYIIHIYLYIIYTIYIIDIHEFKGCLPQILLVPFLNTLAHTFYNLYFFIS